MKPHKWEKEIKAWADGAEIEYRISQATMPTWIEADIPAWNNDGLEFRIKPKQCVNEDEPRGCYRVRCQLGKKCVDDEMSHRLPQPKEPQYLNVYGWLENENICFNKSSDYPYIGKIKLEQDDE